MPTIAEIRDQYPQYHDMSDVQLAGALHDKFYPDMDPTAFADKIGLKPVEPTTINNVGRSFATGVPILGGLLNKVDAATNAALAPMLNPLFDPKDQLSEPTFGERYAHSLRDQEGGDAKFASEHPYIDTSAKLAGGVAAMVPAVAAAPGLFGATGGLATRVGVGGASNAVLGGADALTRGGDTLGGAIGGAALGTALPVAGAVLHGIASPFISNIAARLDPEGFARRQVARGIVESGRPTADIAADVNQAAREGQGVFNVADAMGNAGQRMLSTVARAPGVGRTAVVDALEGRQGMQGRRISNALAEGFDAPTTALQTEARMTGARDTAADTAYGAVRNDAKPVNLTGAIDHIDGTISPGVHRVAGSSNIANDTAEQALQRARNLLTDGHGSMLTDFAAVQRARGDIADWAQTARQGGQGNKARLLGGVLRQIDAAMENASAGHLAANRNFAQASRDIEAVQTGRQAATRGRTEDTIPAYGALSPEGQGAFRSGYVDPLIANTQGAAFGVNKARPLLNSAFQDEAAAMAPGNPLMQRRIGREQTMFETRNQALGGSKTADNLADAAAMGIDPSLVGHVLSGNYAGAVRSLIQAGSNHLTGNTPAVREAVANILLQHGAVAGPALEQLVSQTVARILMVQKVAQGGTRVAAGAVATTTNARKSKPPIFVRNN
jgi:hypothetical protein